MTKKKGLKFKYLSNLMILTYLMAVGWNKIDQNSQKENKDFHFEVMYFIWLIN
jgi:hypothetical protein